MSTPIHDFAVIGAGMAGASIAAELSAYASVIVLEAEDTPGYHATGRSAAFWEECYGGPEIVPLTLASGPFLQEHGLLNSRGALYIGRESDRGTLDEFVTTFSGTGATIERLDRIALAQRVPRLKPDWRDAVWEPACADIDVAGLHAHYLKALAKADVPVMVGSQLAEAKHKEGAWEVACVSGERVRARTLVNAGGAWADEVALKSGIAPIGIEPKRRTVAQLRVAPQPPADMPLVLDINGGFYFKPEAGRIWLSPHDEIPSEPCDAAPEEMDVATALHRFEQVVDWPIEHVERKWAGLRSFARDRLPVYGPDPDQGAFIWFAGQGGFGIQTAPAAARLTAQRLLGNAADSLTVNICYETYDPSRFR